MAVCAARTSALRRRPSAQIKKEAIASTPSRRRALRPTVCGSGSAREVFRGEWCTSSSKGMQAPVGELDGTLLLNVLADSQRRRRRHGLASCAHLGRPVGCRSAAGRGGSAGGQVSVKITKFGGLESGAGWGGDWRNSLGHMVRDRDLQAGLASSQESGDTERAESRRRGRHAGCDIERPCQRSDRRISVWATSKPASKFYRASAARPSWDTSAPPYIFGVQRHCPAGAYRPWPYPSGLERQEEGVLSTHSHGRFCASFRLRPPYSVRRQLLSYFPSLSSDRRATGV